ncbi:MAG: GDSL-type esterase/lipase family protein [Oscillospiraceae bacterium]
MKKMFAMILAAACAFCMSICAYAEPSDASGAEQPQSLLVLGDSIAAGYGLKNYNPSDLYKTTSFGNLLAKDYGLKDTYRNFGHDGLTSWELLDNLRAGQYDDYLNSDVIVISIGGNDLLGELFNFIQNDLYGGEISAETLSPEVMRDKGVIAKFGKALAKMALNLANLDDHIDGITAYIREKNPTSNLILLTLYNPLEEFNDVPLIQNSTTKNIAALNETITRCSKNDDGGVVYTVADVAAAFSGRNTELTNIKQADIHPNAAGHALIKEVVSRHIDAFDYANPPAAPLPQAHTAAVTTNTAEHPANTAPPAEAQQTFAPQQTPQPEDAPTNPALIAVCAIAGLAALGVALRIKLRK